MIAFIMAQCQSCSMKRVLVAVATLALAACAAGMGAKPPAVREEPVTYQDGSSTLKGFVVYDESRQDRRPGILVVHERWGITPHARREARKFAEQGYTAFVLDMYGDGAMSYDFKESGKLQAGVIKNPPVMESRFNAARAELARHRTVDASRIGAVGYCFGGTVALNMARAGADLVAVATFHATLTMNTPAPKQVKPRVLVLNGAADTIVKPDQIEALKRDMEAANADYRFINYPGALHSFTNPDADEIARKLKIPVAYNAEVDEAAKAEAARFFAEAFRK
jgi:dienelactone hydrolase